MRLIAPVPTIYDISLRRYGASSRRNSCAMLRSLPRETSARGVPWGGGRVHPHDVRWLHAERGEWAGPHGSVFVQSIFGNSLIGTVNDES